MRRIREFSLADRVGERSLVHARRRQRARGNGGTPDVKSGIAIYRGTSRDNRARAVPLEAVEVPSHRHVKRIGSGGLHGEGLAWTSRSEVVRIAAVYGIPVVTTCNGE